jgi:peptidoglycan/xylan/chitin deacetylase (PgdA/CDA1 family)
VTGALLAECGRRVRYFRHPFLFTGRDEETRRAVDDFLARRGLAVAKVTIDDSDWVFARALDRTTGELRVRVAAEYVPYMESKAAYFERLSLRLFGRDVPQVLLLHANHANAELLGDLLAMLRRHGYAFVPLEEALADPAYGSADAFYGGAGISWLERWAMTSGVDRAVLREDPAVPPFVMEAAGVASE